MSPSRESTPAQQSMFHIVEDAALLHAISLPDRNISPEFVNELNHHIEIGSQVMNVHTSTSARRAIDQARSTAVSMIGLDQPEHPLYDAFLDLHTDLRYINPRLFGTLKAIAAIGDPVEIIRNAPRCWRPSAKVITQRITYLGRVASVLQWQGERQDSEQPTTPDELARELVREYPEVLMYGVSKLGVLARIAAEFGEEKHRSLPKKIVARHITRRRVEGHIAGITHHKKYELGITSSGNGPGKTQHVKKLQTEIYEGLSDPAYIERVGKPVLWAYFRAHPPSAEALLLYPDVRDFVPKGRCRGNGMLSISSDNVPQFIIGGERWLREMGIPAYPRTPERKARRKQILDTLNWHIALGSYSLNEIPAEEGVSPVYDLVSAHRHAFFDLLGWTHPDHALHDHVQAYAQKRHALIAPRQVVKILNALSFRGVQPITPVLESFFGVLEFKPETLHKKLDVYEAEGEDINTRLQRGATPLRMSADALAARLSKELEKRRFRVAKGFKSRELSPGARRRSSKKNS